MDPAKPSARTRKAMKWALRIIPLTTWLFWAFLLMALVLYDDIPGGEGIMPFLFGSIVGAYIIIVYLVIPNILAGYFNKPEYKWKYIILSAVTSGLWPLIVYYRYVDGKL